MKTVVSTVETLSSF